jgi:hypothetical protein
MAGAQQIRGVVVEDSTSRPISGVKVELLSMDATVHAATVSTSTGWYELTARSEGEFMLRASHEAYRTVIALPVTFGPGESFTVVLRLRDGPIPLEPVVATAISRDRLSGYRERARRAAFGRFITRADIDKLGAYSLSHALRHTPEVRIERVRDGPFLTNGVFMRSLGDICLPTVFVDGVPTLPGQIVDVDDLISAEAVEGIEVYRTASSAPPELQPTFASADNLCGVIAVWSRQLPRVPFTAKRILSAGLLVGASLLLMGISR